MTYCHECGSEIGQVEGFCPYCGISLKPVIVNEEKQETDNEFIYEIVEENIETTVDNEGETAKSEDDLLMSETIMVNPTDFETENIESDPDSSAEVSDKIKEDFEIDKPVTQADSLIEAEEINNLNENDEPGSEEFQENALEESIKSDAAADLIKEPVTESNQPVEVNEAESLFDEDDKNIVEKEYESEFENDSSVAGIEPESAKQNETRLNPQTAGEAAQMQPVVDEGAITIIKGSKELNSSQLPADSSKKQNDETEGVSSTTPNINSTETGGKSAKLKPLDEGTVLNGRYEIVRKIGGGGMGAVYLASDKNLGGVLRAVKEMVQSYIEEEQQDKAISDFKRESMLLTSLEHNSIPTIYDYFYDEKEARFYLVMKYISGGDLSARIKAAPEGRLDEKSVVEWGIQVADVLSYLHERQPPIVYRDLKPANLMIDGNNDRVMLIDFGIARWINKEEKGVTAVGTMGYAPPELFSGNVEPRSDVYSLGSTMFHLLTGADPQSNPLLIFDFQKHPRPRQITPGLSDQIERILMRAVEYNANKRFESSEKMRDALIKHLENLNSGRVSYGITQTPKSVGLEEQPVFCGFCGQKIVASDMFCAFCGAKQPLAQPGVHSQEYLHTKLTARLMIAGTSELDSPTFTLEKTENLVGRRDPLSNIFPEVDLSRYDPQTKISRKHARIWREGEIYLVEDLGSSNGTVLISQTKDALKLEPNKAQMLSDGDKIKLGDTTLQFVVQ